MLIDLDLVKDWLKITSDTYDAAIVALVDSAQAILEKQLRWYFGPSRQKVEVLNGTGTKMMHLLQPPIDGAVTLETRAGPAEAYTTVASTDYENDGRGLYAVAGYNWAKGFRNFRATYNEGFTQCPDDIKQLILDLIYSIWKRRGKEGLSSETLGDYSYTVEDLQNLPRWLSVVNNWKRGRI